MEKFTNSFNENHHLSNYEDEHGRKFVLHIIKSIINTEPLDGCIAYAFYLTDQDPDHNILVEIGKKAFLPDEYATEAARMAAIEPILRDALDKNVDRAYRLLNSKDSTAIN